MNIKWNWGTKLAIWILLFVIFMLTLVIMTVGYDVNLVEKDYYPKGLQYQTRLVAIENAKNIEAVFTIEQNENNLTLHIPDIKIDSGSVIFFRPSNGEFDKTFELTKGSSGSILFNNEDFISGKYILKITWNYNNKEYYTEQIIFLK